MTGDKTGQGSDFCEKTDFVHLEIKTLLFQNSLICERVSIKIALTARLEYKALSNGKNQTGLMCVKTPTF